jgi:hypothetical protein
MIIGTSPFGTAPLGGHPVGAGLTGLVLQIGPDDVTNILQVDSYRLRRTLNGRDEFECTLLTTTSYVPLLGQSVILTIDGGLEFVGTVHERDIAFLSDGRNDYTQIQMRAVDLNEIADRRTVIEIFENMTAGAIIRDIVTKYLASDLIQIGDVQEGPLVVRVVFPYMSAAACFDDLCEQSGFNWNIDQQRALSFFARHTAPAPFTITSANAVFRGLQGRRTRNQYRNVQYVDGGRGVTDRRTVFFRGDGTVQSFNVEYPVYAKPTITLNFVDQTVGIRGIDTGQQWFWNKGETAIGQGTGGTVLTTTDVLSVQYQGLFDLIQVVEDLSAIQERINVQGGSGRYEQLDRDNNLDGQALVEQKGLSLLRRFASLDEVIEFETDVPGLAIGQLATVDVPELGLTDTFLITQLDMQPLLPTTRRYRVTATTGEIKGTYQELFKKLLTSAQPITIREGEILQEVSALHDLVGVTDSITESTLADFAIGVWGTGQVGRSEFGA